MPGILVRFFAVLRQLQKASPLIFVVPFVCIILLLFVIYKPFDTSAGPVAVRVSNTGTSRTTVSFVTLEPGRGCVLLFTILPLSARASCETQTASRVHVIEVSGLWQGTAYRMLLWLDNRLWTTYVEPVNEQLTDKSLPQNRLPIVQTISFNRAKIEQQSSSVLVTGQVWNIQGAVQKNALVQVSPEGADRWLSAQTNQNGEFTLLLPSAIQQDLILNVWSEEGHTAQRIPRRLVETLVQKITIVPYVQ